MSLGSIIKEVWKLLDFERESLVVSKKLYNVIDYTEKNDCLKEKLEAVLFKWLLSKPFGFSLLIYNKIKEENICRRKLNTFVRIPSSLKEAYQEKPTVFQNRNTELLSPEEKEEIEFFVSASTIFGLYLKKEQTTFSTIIDLEKKLNISQKEDCSYYAGFIFSLGLKGCLKNLPLSFVFELMQKQKKQITCSLLIGLGISNMSTCNQSLTKTNKLHLPMFDEPDIKENEIQNEIPRDVEIQMSSIFSLGFLYLQKPDFGIARAFLLEIKNGNSCQTHNEIYFLSLGINLGYLFLSFGSKKDYNEMMNTLDLEETLICLVNSRIIDETDLKTKKDSWCKKIPFQSTRSISSLICLGLIYLQSEKDYICNSILFPSEESHLYRERPDIFFYKTICRGMIMWNKISPNTIWIEENIPLIIKQIIISKYKLYMEGENVFDALLETACLIYLNILKGLSLCISLKYAGSGDERINKFFEEIDSLVLIIRKMCLDRRNAFERIVFWNVENTEYFETLCHSICFSGSCDLNLFQKIRARHNHREENIQYQNTLMESLSLGFLFLGEGKYTISTSSKQSVAFLLSSFVYSFPSKIFDKDYSFNMLNYFWALSITKKTKKEKTFLQRKILNEKFVESIKIIEEEFGIKLL